MSNAIAKTELPVGALKNSELTLIQSMAESILDSIATIKAGRESVKGYLLRADENGDINIVKEVSFHLESRKTEEI